MRRTLRRGPKGVVDGQPVKIPAPSAVVEPKRDRGTKRERPCGRPSNRVGGNPETGWRGRSSERPSLLESTREKSSWRRQRDVRTVNRHRWARRVASGERVKRGQGTRHNDPVTSEEGMPFGVRASRPRLREVAVNRPKRLFSKNTGACQAAQGAVYALTPARCRKVKGRGQGGSPSEALSRSPGKRRP